MNLLTKIERNEIFANLHLVRISRPLLISKNLETSMKVYQIAGGFQEGIIGQGFFD